MSWRTVVVSQRCKLDFKLNYLMIRGDELQKVHISEISVLIIENTAVALTAYLVAELVRNKVKVIFCDEKRNPCAELMPYYGSHDTSAKVQDQIEWSLETKQIVWTEIVRDKITKQKELLALLEKEEASLLQMYIEDLRLNDQTNREGHSAKVYFNALFGKSFSRSDGCPINAMLNYGYGILLSSFSREISANGYITQLGLSHHNTFNPFNFASDLMEPFRPLVDGLVFSVNPQKFEKEEKIQVLHLLSQRIEIGEKRYFLPDGIQIFCKSVFDALNTADIERIRSYRYEL